VNHLPWGGRNRRRSGGHRRYRRVAAVRVLVGALVGGVLAAPAASAHVTVNPREAPRGGHAALAFRVPNEQDDSSTIGLRVSFPEEHPLRSVRVKPKVGWTYEVEMRELDEPIVTDSGEEVTEVVSTITWSGGEIAPDQFEEFDVSVGPLPEDADEMMFPSIQIYDNGDEVGWIEERVEGEEEPDRPAPLLTLVDPEEPGSGGSGGGEEEASGMSVSNMASQDDVDSANRLAVAGLLVGIIGVVTGAVALVRGRRQLAAAAPTSTSTPAATTTSET
jgi:uncharacterized protein YcnI